MRLFQGSSGAGYLTLTTPRCHIVFLLWGPYWWFHRGRWSWDRVVGTLIVRAGPVLVTVWGR